MEAVDVHLGTVQSKIYANLNFGNLAEVSLEQAASIGKKKSSEAPTNHVLTPLIAKMTLLTSPTFKPPTS